MGRRCSPQEGNLSATSAPRVRVACWPLQHKQVKMKFSFPPQPGAGSRPAETRLELSGSAAAGEAQLVFVSTCSQTRLQSAGPNIVNM